jgi:hypothetical protein
VKRLSIYKKNPFYWEYNGRPVVLLGGSVEDNLFQIDKLEEHLDLLVSAGGNYIRNTMSSRDEGNVWPFGKTPEGKYDLNLWGKEYWKRFCRALNLTAERDIIMQIEMWDRFDYARDYWQLNPFNPRNNINYTEEESKLKETIDTHPGENESRFFYTVPKEDNNELILEIQKRMIDKLLSYSLDYSHVLYCMDNETSGSENWGAFWSEYIKERASEKGMTVYTTEMWDEWDIIHEQHSRTLDHPETYAFCDVSQNNQRMGQVHWDNFQNVRKRLIDNNMVRPLNTVKTYGADGGRFGTDRDGIERFWRHIIGGAASARFHRPDSGLGLGEKAQANLKSMRLLLEKIDIFSSVPHNDLLCEREEDCVYCTADPGKEYALFFTDGGEVTLDTSAVTGKFSSEWLDVMNSQFTGLETGLSGTSIKLTCPGKGFWAVIVKPEV